MINFNFTEEDKDILRKYRNQKFFNINQLLISNSEVDLQIFMSCNEKDKEYKLYSESVIEENIELIIDLYSVMLKSYYQKYNKEAWALSYGTSVAEIEK